MVLHDIRHYLISIFFMFRSKFVVKDVVLQLRPLLSEKQLLVSVVAGIKLKDLQVRVLNFTDICISLKFSGIRFLFSIFR